MTDKELLEHAAKAMGFVEPHSYREKTNSLLWLSASGFPSTWSPLADNNDAFEMAVKLSLLTDHNVQIAPVNVWEGEDPYAATRRAIVRAAAEIGKNMEYAKREE